MKLINIKDIVPGMVVVPVASDQDLLACYENGAIDWASTGRSPKLFDGLAGHEHWLYVVIEAIVVKENLSKGEVIDFSLKELKDFIKNAKDFYSALQQELKEEAEREAQALQKQVEQEVNYVEKVETEQHTDYVPEDVSTRLIPTDDN